MMPGVQNPHWLPPVATKAAAQRSRTSASSPSTVSTDRPATRRAGVTQATRGAPSTSTVQHPHWPWGLQPSFTEWRPRSSRSTSSSDVPRSGTSTSTPSTCNTSRPDTGRGAMPGLHTGQVRFGTVRALSRHDQPARGAGRARPDWPGAGAARRVRLVGTPVRCQHPGHRHRRRPAHQAADRRPAVRRGRSLRRHRAPSSGWWSSLQAPGGTAAARLPSPATITVRADGTSGAVVGPTPIAAHHDGTPIAYYPIRATFPKTGNYVIEIEVDGAKTTQALQVFEPSAAHAGPAGRADAARRDADARRPPGRAADLHPLAGLHVPRRHPDRRAEDREADRLPRVDARVLPDRACAVRRSTC